MTSGDSVAVRPLPKTQWGKILRGAMHKTSQGESYRVPPR